MESDREDNRASILAVGDLMFGVCALDYAPRDLKLPYRVSAGKDLFDENILEHFRGHNCRIGNLECLLTDRNQSYETKRLVGPSESLEYLQQLEFNVLSMANNHVNDYGQEYVSETKELLRSAGIDYLYSPENDESIVVREIAGQTVAFLGYGLKPYYFVETDNSDDPDNYKDLGFYVSALRRMEDDAQIEPLGGGNIAPLLNSVKKAQALNVDHIVLYIHWGYAYARIPSLFQVEIAHLLVDAGVDVILGSHPHVIQPIERYKGKIIAYSLGNFLFDMWRDAASQGLMLSLDLGTEATYECFLSLRRKDLGVTMTDSAVDLGKMDILIQEQNCHFAYPKSLSHEMSKMESIVNDPVKYFHYRRACAGHKSIREYLFSELPLSTKISRFWRHK